MKRIIEAIKFLSKELSESHKLADWIFTIIILFVSITSFFHVLTYWTLTNREPFHIVTAIATELTIIGSMIAMRYTYIAWLPFVLGVFVQGIGNIFYSYISIDTTSQNFNFFVELFEPQFKLMYGDELIIANYKRVLAYCNGLFYLSPIVFLWAKISLRLNIKKEQEQKNQTDNNTPPEEKVVPVIDDLDEVPIINTVPPTPVAEVLTDVKSLPISDDDADNLTVTIEVYGCTNPLANNYNPYATVDDGSCVYAESETQTPSTETQEIINTDKAEQAKESTIIENEQVEDENVDSEKKK